MDLTDKEIDLLVEALMRAASRHESEARFNPRNAKVHDDKAIAMRKLRSKLLRAKVPVGA
jgi:hypothetical protein